MSIERPIRVVIQQPNLRSYRLGFYQALARDRRLQFVLVYGSRKHARNVAPEGFEARFAPLRVFEVLGHRFFWHTAQIANATRARCDVIVLAWGTRYLSLVPALVRARLSGVGVVLWSHAYSKRESARKRQVRNALAGLGDILVTYNRAGRTRLIEEGWPPERVHVALNSLDQGPIRAARDRARGDQARLETLRREHGLEGKALILFVSRLFRENRVDMLLDATKRLEERGLPVVSVIVGEGPEKAQLEAQAREVGVEGSVRFLGAIYGEEELAPWFVLADCFCYPANIGLSILHAFGYGLPVVTSDRTEAQNPEIEALRPEENGLVYKDSDVEDLAAALQRILGDDALRERLGAEAFRTVEEDFSIDRMAEGMAEAIIAAHARAQERLKR